VPTQSKHQESNLAKIASQIVSQFRESNLTYDQTRYVFKMARKALGLKANTKGQQIPKALSEAQVEKFFSAISDSKHYLIYKLIYVCGLRVSGLCNLKREDVNLDDCTITIQWNKTNSGRIPFPKSLQPLLRMHLAATTNDEFLFQSSHKTKAGGARSYSTRTIQFFFKQYLKKAALPVCGVHSLRHSCLSHLAAKGLSSSQLQAVSLHRSKASLDSYVRLSAVEVRNAYDSAMK